MKKSHSLSNTWRKLQGKKPQSISTWHLILLLAFAFLMLFGPLIGTIVGVAFPSAMSPPVNWKMATAFLVLFNGWYFYVIFRNLPAKMAQMEARLEAKKKLGTRKALQATERRASRGGTDAT